MLKNKYEQEIFAIAFCEICLEFAIFLNRRTYMIDAERKVSIHAGIKHGNIKNGMGWTSNEREMAIIRKKPGYKEGYL